MIDYLPLILTIMIPVIAGYGMLRCIVDEEWPVPLTLAVSYALGSMLLPMLMLMYDLTGIPWSGATIYGGLMGMGGASLGMSLIRGRKRSVEETAYMRLVDNDDMTTLQRLSYALLMLYLAVHVWMIFWRALNMPVFVWDAMSTSMFKAHVFFHENSLASLKNVPRPSYPLHVPLWATWISMNLQHWNDQWIKIIFPLNFMAFIVINYYFLRCFVHKLWALIGVGLIFTSEYALSFAAVAYREWTLVLYNCSTVFWIILWSRHQKNAYLILAAVFSGAGTFVKLEGNGYWMIHMFLLLAVLWMSKQAIAARVKKLIQFTVIAIIPIVLYAIGKIVHGVEIAERAGFDFQWTDWPRIPATVKALFKFMFVSGHWNILWWVFVLSVVLVFVQRVSRDVYLLLGTIVLFLGLHFGVIVFTENYDLIIGYYEKVNVPRLLLHFFPLVTTVTILLAASTQPNRTRHSLTSLGSS